MWTILALIKKNLVVIIPVAMLAGFISGITVSDTSVLKSLILPLTVLMILPMMVTFPLSKLFSSSTSGKLLGLNLFFNFVVIPGMAFLLGRLFFPEKPGFILGLVMMGIIPTSGMTISWTGFAKGNIKAAITLMVLGLIIGAVVTPFYLEFFMGNQVNFSMFTVFRQILMVIFFPMVLGAVIRMLIIRVSGAERFEGYWKKNIPSISSLGVVIIVFVAIALKAKALLNNPSDLLLIILPVLAFYVIHYVLISLIGRIFLNRDDAVALVFSTVMRNLSLGLGIAITAFPELGSQAALVMAVAYVVQVQSASLYVKFGSKYLSGRRVAEENTYDKVTLG